MWKSGAVSVMTVGFLVGRGSPKAPRPLFLRQPPISKQPIDAGHLIRPSLPLFQASTAFAFPRAVEPLRLTSRFRTFQVCLRTRHPFCDRLSSRQTDLQGPRPLVATPGGIWRGGGPMFGIRRRELIALLGGAAAWPLAARAQQPERMRRIGVLMGVADDPETKG